MAKYKFLAAVDYDKNGRRYEAGDVDALKDWRKVDVKAAVRAYLIERTGRDETITVSSDSGTELIDSGTELIDSDTELLATNTGRSGGGESWQQDKP